MAIDEKFHGMNRIQRERMESVLRGTQSNYLQGYNDAIADAIAWIKRHHAHIQFNEHNLFGINLEHFRDGLTQ